MIKVLCLTPNPSDGTSWYRSALPIARLQQDYDDLQFIEHANNQVNWNDLIHFDVLFLQRPYLKYHLEIMNQAIFLGLKVWIDYDDCLWKVPEHNPTNKIYNNPEVQACMRHMISIADPKYVAISVSTHQLLAEVKKINQNALVYVIKNALDEKTTWHDGKNMAEWKDKKNVVWRGSHTHDRDLDCYRDDLVKLSDSHQMVFMGTDPWWLHLNAKFIQPHDILSYYNTLRANRSRTRLFFVCLEDNEFNRCKSNIAFLEAHYAEAVCVVPNWGEWMVPGAIVYDASKKGNLATMVGMAMSMSEDAWKRKYAETHDYISRHRTLKAANIQRHTLLRTLINNQ
jgi:hypothetical protein